MTGILVRIPDELLAKIDDARGNDSRPEL